MTTNEAYENGRKAFHDGRVKSANPYDPRRNEVSHFEWDMGFDDAADEVQHKQAN